MQRGISQQPHNFKKGFKKQDLIPSAPLWPFKHAGRDDHNKRENLDLWCYAWNNYSRWLRHPSLIILCLKRLVKVICQDKYRLKKIVPILPHACEESRRAAEWLDPKSVMTDMTLIKSETEWMEPAWRWAGKQLTAVGRLGPLSFSLISQAVTTADRSVCLMWHQFYAGFPFWWKPPIYPGLGLAPGVC